MKISSLLLAMLVTTAATLKAAVAEGQKLKEMKLAMKAEQEPLLTVLRKIESATSVHFVYNAAKVNGDQPVSITLDNVSLEEALNNLLSAKNYGWKEKGGNIIIFSNVADTIHINGRVLNRAEPPEVSFGVSVGGAYNKSKILKLSQPRIIEGDYIYREGGTSGKSGCCR